MYVVVADMDANYDADDAAAAEIHTFNNSENSYDDANKNNQAISISKIV